MKTRNIILIVIIVLAFFYFRKRSKSKISTGAGSGLTPGASGGAYLGVFDNIANILNPSTDVKIVEASSTTTTATTSNDVNTGTIVGDTTKPSESTPTKPPEPAPTLTTASASSAESKFTSRVVHRNSAFLNVQ